MRKAVGRAAKPEASQWLVLAAHVQQVQGPFRQVHSQLVTYRREMLLLTIKYDNSEQEHGALRNKTLGRRERLKTYQEIGDSNQRLGTQIRDWKLN